MPTRLLGFLLWYSKAEKDINRIFGNHTKTLQKYKFDMIGEIGDWSQKLISQIDGHARDETERLEQNYQKEMRRVEDERQKALARVSEYEQRKDDEQLQTLSNACSQFKLQLIELGSFEQSIRVVLESKEKSASVQLTTADEPLTDVEEPIVIDYPTETRIADGPGTDSLNGSSPSGEEAYKDPLTTPYAVDDVVDDDLHSTTRKISASKETYVAEDNRNKQQASAENYELTQCPVCFMIFSLNVTQHDRAQHVYEHYPAD